MIKKIVIGVFGVGVILIILLLVLIIGIPTRLIFKGIDETTVVKCQEVVNVIIKNRDNINNNLRVDAAAEGKCIRYFVSKPGDIDSLFNQIGNSDKNLLIDFLSSNTCEGFEISEVNDCFIFEIKSSFKNNFIVGSHEELLLVYENKPSCNCKDNPLGSPNYPFEVKQITDRWHKVIVIVSHRHFGC